MPKNPASDTRWTLSLTKATPLVSPLTGQKSNSHSSLRKNPVLFTRMCLLWRWQKKEEGTCLQSIKNSRSSPSKFKKTILWNPLTKFLTLTMKREPRDMISQNQLPLQIKMNRFFITRKLWWDRRRRIMLKTKKNRKKKHKKSKLFNKNKKGLNNL